MNKYRLLFASSSRLLLSPVKILANYNTTPALRAADSQTWLMRVPQTAVRYVSNFSYWSTRNLSSNLSSRFRHRRQSDLIALIVTYWKDVGDAKHGAKISMRGREKNFRQSVD